MSFRLRDDVSLAETEHGAVLLDQRGGRYWQTNATGSLVLRALLDGQTADEICCLLPGSSQVSADQVAADISAFRERLRTANLVTW